VAAALAVTAVPAAASAAPHRVTTVRYGPFVVPAMGMSTGQAMDTGAMKSFVTKTAPPCRGCSITAMRASLVNAQNRVQNWNTGVMLHHVVLFNLARPDLTCTAGRVWKQRFFASGNERTPMRLPGGYGYRVHPRDRWRVLTDLMNMSMRPRTLYVRIRLAYTRRHLEPVTPMWLDVNNCGNSEYSIPKGRSNTTWSTRSPVSGRFVAAAGHLHDGGVRIVLRNATRHHTIVNSVAGYRRQRHAYQGHISSMTGRRGRNLGRVRAGDTLRLHSIYDSPTARDDVMGIVLAYLARAHR
jgi:hypothetical protein